ncbi:MULTISPECIES: hypothetical protein [unclassified Crossiella]|uniref:hypothetical protein n=1 Tax=unclassified Crossiella TaxID=2620835 RepID=UPI001FFF828E|nr:MULTISPECIES: hypothetical protein [unclassified Crossiella]MCK2241844.1 hypothetical protein [Crossiella sp. S99.2]MCK2255747.1 hypothetical protein [Crossiella sp. S99.1]
MATVLPCARHSSGPPSTAWLLTAIIKIVTVYTRPGQRVLLLAPSCSGLPLASIGPEVRTPSRHREYDCFLEARWAVFRLGRTVQVRAEGQAAAHPGDSSPPHAESESGPGLLPAAPSRLGDGEVSPDQPADAITSPGLDSFDLIIIAVESSASDHPELRYWPSRLTRRGTLAVITHSDRTASGFRDPTGTVVRTVRESGLCYLDHLALLREPVCQPRSDGGEDGLAGEQSFADLLVFTAAPSGEVAPANRGDLR